jgi:hypothetical protein
MPRRGHGRESQRRRRELQGNAKAIETNARYGVSCGGNQPSCNLLRMRVPHSGRGNLEPAARLWAAEKHASLFRRGFPHDRAEMPEALDLFGRFAAITRGMRRLGSTALNLCYVASGRLDGYYERGILAWDIAAGV